MSLSKLNAIANRLMDAIAEAKQKHAAMGGEDAASEAKESAAEELGEQDEKPSKAARAQKSIRKALGGEKEPN
jgi:hypothetical protein